MAPNAVDEGGHETVPAHGLVPPESERHAGREVDARKRFDRNLRFRGHGPLLQKKVTISRPAARQGGIYKGPSPCWYAVRPSRRGPSGPRDGHGPCQ